MSGKSRSFPRRLLAWGLRRGSDLLRRAWDFGDDLINRVFPRLGLRRVARHVYSYHNLGPDAPPVPEEKAPCGLGERYNFDRMFMMVSSYDFTHKNVLDLGCNSGWFSLQVKLLGAATTVGVDYLKKRPLGSGLRYAIQLERYLRLELKFVNADLETIDFEKLARRHGLEGFDAAMLLSVLHHIGPESLEVKARFFENLFRIVRDVIFYEDHEFWNDLFAVDGSRIEVLGEGHRYGWNEDLSWQRRIHSIERYENLVIERFSETWRREVLMLDRFAEIRFLGFSEKRRPMLALFKRRLTRIGESEGRCV